MYIYGRRFARGRTFYVTLSKFGFILSNFWTNSGEQYADANIQAAKRGVKILRIFAVSLDKMEEMKPVIIKQIEAGIDVRLIDPDTVEPQYKRDFAIYDEKYVISLTLTPDSRTVVESWIIRNGTERDVYSKIFDHLLRGSRDARRIFTDMFA